MTKKNDKDLVEKAENLNKDVETIVKLPEYQGESEKLDDLVLRSERENFSCNAENLRNISVKKIEEQQFEIFSTVKDYIKKAAENGNLKVDIPKNSLGSVNYSKLDTWCNLHGLKHSHNLAKGFYIISWIY